jgi:hypothetical protein
MEMRSTKIYSYASCSILLPTSWTIVVMISWALRVLIQNHWVGLLVVCVLSVPMSKRCMYTSGPFFLNRFSELLFLYYALTS